MITEITTELVKDTWQACWPRERIAELYPQPHTPLEVLTKTDGKWESITPQDRFWTVLRSEVLPDELMRLFACWCAEQVMPIFEKAHPNDKRPREAIETARRYSAGLATEEELAAAGAAARAAAGAAAGATAWATAGATARAAAGATARAAAGATAWAAARAAQLAQLVKMVRVWTENGDVYGGERDA